MKTAIMKELGKIEIVETPMPQIGDQEVLIKIKYVGVCGSDVHYFEHGKIGDFVVDFPFVLGHECSGVVEAIGKNVKNVAVGDKVTVEPGDTCGTCKFCTSGHYNLCPDVKFLATPPFDGCLAEYIAAPAKLVFKIPDSLTLEHGALVEPFAIGMYATRNTVSLGDKVLVTGAGCIGLVTMLAAIARGASKVYIADVLENRLEMAKKFGGIPVNSADPEAVKAMEEVDTFVECTGVADAVNMAISKLRNGGSGVLVGLSSKDTVPVNLNTVINKELTLSSIFRYANIYPQTIEAMENLKNRNLDVRDMITTKFKFDDVQKGFVEVKDNKRTIVKALIEL